jgi:hypothetical protein
MEAIGNNLFVEVKKVHGGYDVTVGPKFIGEEYINYHRAITFSYDRLPSVQRMAKRARREWRFMFAA